MFAQGTGQGHTGHIGGGPVRACWGGGATRRASGEAGVRKCPSASRQPRRSSRASRER